MWYMRRIETPKMMIHHDSYRDRPFPLLHKCSKVERRSPKLPTRVRVLSLVQMSNVMLEIE